MSSVVISGDTSGQVTLAAPAVAGTSTLTLQAATATSAVNTLGTAVASTSGTSIDFTSLPSWVKRITLQWNGVSTSGTSNLQVQLGTGSTSYTTSGYNCISTLTGSGSATTAASTGFVVVESAAAASTLYYGTMVITNINGNNWVATSQFGLATRNVTIWSSGSIALGAVVTAVRTTTVNGTDTFDAGTVNILYEG